MKYPRFTVEAQGGMVCCFFAQSIGEQDGHARTSGGDHVLAWLSGPGLQHVPSYDLGNGSHVLKYTPGDAGLHQLVSSSACHSYGAASLVVPSSAGS